MTSCCPACKRENLEHIFLQYEGKCVTSDYLVFEEAKIDNCICKDCGLIFNLYGTRVSPEHFYKNSYGLMTQNTDSKIQSFAGGKGRSQALVTYEVLKGMIPLDDAGSVLEAGAGKGEFLSYFAKDNRGWKIQAFEPSQSFEYLQEIIPGADLQNCGYLEYAPTSGTRHDLIVALGVLEHVNDPLNMLRWANQNLKTGGHFFIRVPNFVSNPNDLFCADHLSKLTIATITSFANASGFEVGNVEEKGVPVFVTLKKVSDEFGDVKNVYAENYIVSQKNGKVAKQNIEAVIDARHQAISEKGALGVFGLGASGLFAPFYGGFEPSDITLFIDENQTLWGNTVLGCPLKGLDGINEYSISHVALAVSPVYREQIIAKLTPFGVVVI